VAHTRAGSVRGERETPRRGNRGRIFCNRTNSCTQNGCTDYTDAVFECTANPVGPFFGAVITYDSSFPGWDVTRKDGMVYKFRSGSSPLQSITDR
jgi:hypothetical protein